MSRQAGFARRREIVVREGIDAENLSLRKFETFEAVSAAPLRRFFPGNFLSKQGSADSHASTVFRRGAGCFETVVRICR
jgi:hypothetical protein